MTEHHTFLFADLAGFTALTEAHGDERAADLVAEFSRWARALFPAYESEEVKAIGDALMIRSSDPSQGVGLAVELATRVGGRHGFPAVRVGVHTGPAVERASDWFGAAVNLASRVSEVASAGEVLVTADTRAAALEASPGLVFRHAGTRQFKNVGEPVELYAVTEAADASLSSERRAVDPVCRMTVDCARSAAERRHRGVDYRFCSAACAAAFDGDPDRYRNQRPARDDLRASDRSRGRAAARLRRAHRRGRIDQRERDERLAHVLAARTRGELAAVIRDLPGSYRLRPLRNG